jgi:hypothetical protein
VLFDGAPNRLVGFGSSSRGFASTTTASLVVVVMVVMAHSVITMVVRVTVVGLGNRLVVGTLGL